MTSLTIDTRELKVIEYFNKYNENYQVSQLDIGDIHLSKGDDTIYIIERKSICDMLSSIKDGRYKEQKVRLLSCLANQKAHHIFYILEGNIEKLSNVQKKLIYGSWISCQFRDNINIIRTNSVNETCEFITRLIDRINSNCSDFIKNDNVKTIDINYLKTIKTKKKHNITPNIAQILMLATIPNVSSSISTKIIEEYGSLHNIYKRYELCCDEQEKEELLSSIQLNEKRKIGKVVSKIIYNYLIKNK